MPLYACVSYVGLHYSKICKNESKNPDTKQWNVRRKKHRLVGFLVFSTNQKLTKNKHKVQRRTQEARSPSSRFSAMRFYSRTHESKCVVCETLPVAWWESVFLPVVHVIPGQPFAVATNRFVEDLLQFLRLSVPQVYSVRVFSEPADALQGT